MVFVYLVNPSTKEAIHYQSHKETSISEVFQESYQRTLLDRLDVSNTSIHLFLFPNGDFIKAFFATR